jgi:hypothetical protein
MEVFFLVSGIMRPFYANHSRNDASAGNLTSNIFALNDINQHQLL